MADDISETNDSATESSEPAPAPDAAGIQGKIQQTVGGLKDAAAAKVDDLRAKASATADQLRSTAAAKGDELRSAASAKADEWRGVANAKAEEYRGRAEEAWGDVKVQARSYQEDGEAYVRENPTRALVLGVAAGFVLGLLVRK